MLGGKALDQASLPHVITRGLYPELWRLPDIAASDFYHSYLATYLERDVRQILQVSSLRDVERFIRILAARSGQLLNKSEVARGVGVSVKVVGDWISVLEVSNIITLLEPYCQNFGKRIAKSPRLYFNDTGLLCFLLGIRQDNLPHSSFLGAVWETLVYAELRKHKVVAAYPKNIWFYRDQFANEIDFVLESAGYLSLLEVKWQEQIDSKATQTIQKIHAYLLKSTLLRPGQHYVVCRTAAAFTRDDIRIIHLGQLQEVYELRLS